MKRVLFVIALLLLPAVAHAQLQPVPPQASSAAEGYHQFVGTQLSNLTVNWQSSTTARYLMIFDSTAESKDTATPCSTTAANGCLLYCLYVTASTTAPDSVTLSWVGNPIQAVNGINAAMSSGAGCGTFTVDGSNDFFYGQVK